MKITVFTPTYNRAYILQRTYDSLKKQGYKDFEWVLLDDGSADETAELVASWKEENAVEIKYYRQKNQGRFAAFNNAKRYFTGELLVFLDSDDYLLDNSLAEIAKTWDSIEEKEKCSGIIAYIETVNHELIGTEFPDGLEMERIYVLYDKYKMQGDKFLAFRNDLIQKYEYPVYEGERFTGDSIVFNKINDECPMYLLRKKMMYREYLEDGVALTSNLRQHHLKSPNGMREHYVSALQHERCNYRNIVKHSIGYVAFAKMSGWSASKILKNSPRKGWTCFCYLGGIVYYWKVGSR